MPDWSKRKRLEATIAGELPDRPPIAIWRHWPGDDQRADSLAAAHLKWQIDYDWDLIKVSPASSFAISDWGVKDRWVGSIEGTREYTHRAVNEPGDWESLRPLDPNKGMLATQLETLRMVVSAAGESIPVVGTIFSPLAQAKNIAGPEKILSHMRSHPASFHRGLETILASTLRYLDEARKTGISGMFYAVQQARYPLMNHEEFAAFGRAYDLRLLADMQDLWLNMTHIHGTDIMFDSVADYPVQFVNWHDRETSVSIAEGLKQIPGAASGGVSRWSLHQESPERALAEASEAVSATSGRRLMLGTGCVAMITSPTSNIRALREAVDTLKYSQRRQARLTPPFPYSK